MSFTCKSLWIKAFDKWVNINVNISAVCLKSSPGTGSIWGLFHTCQSTRGPALWLVTGLSGGDSGLRAQYFMYTPLMSQQRDYDGAGKKEQRGKKATDWWKVGQSSWWRTVRVTGSNPPLNCDVISASALGQWVGSPWPRPTPLWRPSLTSCYLLPTSLRSC